MTIEVQYPTEITKEVLRKKDTVFNPWHPENNQDRMVTVSIPVNREFKVYVRKTERLVQEEFMTNEDYCLEQTGLTPSEYQLRHKRAWNE